MVRGLVGMSGGGLSQEFRTGQVLGNELRGSGNAEHLCQRFVLMGLLMLEESVQPMGLDDAL